MTKRFFSGWVASGVLGVLLFQLSEGASAQTRDKVLYRFCSETGCPDGAIPVASLIELNGTFYGTTEYGGSYRAGTVFSIDPTTGTETVLHSFSSFPDGAAPEASLIDVNGTLYGTTVFGGLRNCDGGTTCGTVFSLDPGTGAETVVYSFCSQANCTDGNNPYASLIEVDGTLYGTTSSGGNQNDGTVFSLDPNSGTEAVLHAFGADVQDGLNPQASLIDVRGTLYGTTVSGGNNSGGTVFSVDPSTGAETVVYSFCSQTNCTDGQNPYSSLIEVKGTLYGTTYAGGSQNGGTVFSLEPKSGTERVLYSFCSLTACNDGGYPQAPLIEVKGELYGTTVYGGASGGGGAVFSLDPGTGTETALYSFCYPYRCSRGGQNPKAGLLKLEGRLYGTTYSGGTRESAGVVFSVKGP